MGHSTQTVHLSCVKISSIPKRTKTSVLLSLLSAEDHRVRPKWFMSLWYVWRKPYTYLAMTLTPSPNGPKRDSRWATSPRSSIWCLKNDFWAYGTVSVNRAPILRQDYHCLQTDQNKLPVEPHKLGVPSSASKTISKRMVRLAQIVHLSCTNPNTISKRTETRFQMAHVT
jgi:hypothetical protein